MISRSAIVKAIDPFYRKGLKQQSFDFKFIKLGTGEIIHVVDAICTSTCMKTRSIRIKVLASEEIRAIRTCTIIEFNGKEVTLK